MRHCPRCGIANDPRSNFCLNCGLDLRPAGTSDNDTRPPERRRRSRWVTVTLAVIAVVLLGCVTFFVWALTPGGQREMGEFATWAANEATRQAGS